MARRISCILLFLIATPMSLSAQEIGPNFGSLNGFHNGAVSSGRGYMINYSVNYKLWSHLQEPVYKITFRWSFDERAIASVPSYMSADDFPVDALISTLDKNLRDEIRPYDVKVRIYGHPANDPSLNVYVQWDIGVPAESGQESYNTPASPEGWGSVFYTNASGYRVNDSIAKSIFKAGFIATETRIYSILWHDDAYITAQAKKYKRGAAESLRKAAEQQINALAKIQGLSEENVTKITAKLTKRLSEAEARRKRGDPDFLKGVEAIVNKLNEGLPPEMRNGDRAKIYETQRAAIAVDLNKTLEHTEYKVELNSEYDKWEQAKTLEVAKRKPSPLQDPLTGRWGYGVNSHGSLEWIIPPKYLFAPEFNDEGVAEVVIDESITTRVESHYYGCSEQDFSVTIKTSTSAYINVKGEFIGKPFERSTDNRPGIALCARSH